MHLVAGLGDHHLTTLSRDRLQRFLDEKSERLSASVLNHLRHALKASLQMAVEEGYLAGESGRSLVIPRGRRSRKTMSAEQVRTAIGPSRFRERIIVQLAVVVGQRPGEIFGLSWG